MRGSADSPKVTGRRALRGLLRSERGFTLTELLVVMAIMGLVIGSLSTLFVSGLRRPRSSSTCARRRSRRPGLALDMMRREMHNACQATVGGGGTTVTLKTLAVPNDAWHCAVTSSTWCVVGSGSRYALYRKAGATCNASGVRRADYVTANTVFSVVTGSGLLAKIAIDMPVNVKPTMPRLSYRLQDQITLRNSQGRG